MSKDEFYQNLNSETYCGYHWCKTLYGYAYTDHDFLNKVLDKLEELNRPFVKNIYGLYVKCELRNWSEEVRPDAEWQSNQTQRDYERKVKETEWQKVEKNENWMSGMY